MLQTFPSANLCFLKYSENVTMLPFFVYAVPPLQWPLLPSPASVFSRSYPLWSASSTAFFWPQLLEFHLSVPFLAPYLCSMALRRNLPCCANYWWSYFQFTVNSLNTLFFVFSRAIHSVTCIRYMSVDLNWISKVTAYNNFLPKIKKTLVFTRWICKSPSTVASYMCGVIWYWGLVREGTTQEQWHALDVLNLYVNYFCETCTRVCPVFLNVNCGTQQNLSGGLGRPYISVCPGNAGLRGSLDFLFPVPLHHPYTIVG